MIRATFATLFMLTYCYHVHGDLILNVDIGTFNQEVYDGPGAAPFGQTGQVWNSVSNNSSSILLDANGVATGISIELVGAGGFSNVSSSVNSANASTLMNDYRFTFGERMLDIRGLTPGDSYEIFIYSAGDNTNQGSEFFEPTETGGTTYSPPLGSRGTSGNPITTADGSAATLTEGIHYRSFEGIIGSEGRFSIGQFHNGVGSTAQAINGLQLRTTSVAVPELSSLFLIPFYLGLSAYHRRRRVTRR